MEINKSDVVFNEAEHTYELRGKKLRGVTPIVSWLFPETYSGISEDVLNMAAERGHAIHEECQMYNEIGVIPESYEGKKFVSIMQNYGFKHLASEYLVSDKKNIASSIDLLCTDFTIIDYKCTSSIHWNNVTFQTNIYKYLFELQNKGAKCKRLGVIWLPKACYGECKYYDLRILDENLVKKAVKAYLKGEEPDKYRDALFPDNFESQKFKVPECITSVESKIVDFERRIKSLKDDEQALKDALIENMVKYGVKKWETENLSVTYIEPSCKKTFDATRFKEEHNDMFDEYQKESKVNQSIRIKIK